jgi:hypothetical protein
MPFLIIILAFWFVVPFSGGYVLAQMANAWKRRDASSPLGTPRFNPVTTAFLTGIGFEAAALAGLYYWAHYVK